MKQVLKSTTALVATLSLLQPTLVNMAQAANAIVTAQPIQPTTPADITANFVNPATQVPMTNAQIIAALQQKVKYVFVIFNENHSFDNEYGTLPGVNGIYSKPAAQTPGFTQTFTDAFGNVNTVQPFLLGPQQNSTFNDSVDHSHTGLARKINVGANGVAQMNQFALDEYLAHTKGNATTAAQQASGINFSRLVMSHIDCDTIPFFWNYASRFTIFDNIFATEDTPSTPNAVAMLAGQSGETQWVKHPAPAGGSPTADGFTGTVSGSIPQQSGSTINTLPGFDAPIVGSVGNPTFSGTSTTQGPPLVNDPQPFWGSQYDATTTNRQPTGPKEGYGSTNIASNLTFASVPLTAMGSNITAITSQDYNPNFDLPDIQQDIPYIQSLNRAPVAWKWYQNGYDAEPTDAHTGVPHENYVSHHQGPQYFGYLANNPAQRANFGGENDFFNDVANNNLPQGGGIFYVRGGYYNLNYPTVTPPIQNANYPAALTQTDINKINATKSGDDDHPSYTDRQISESMAARVINAVASNPELWAQSAIIVTYDESDGFYDHVPPRILSYGPDGLPLSRGVRVPLLLISPYARVHAVGHAEGDHNAVIQTINAIFNLPALSSLPDEAQALAAGNSPAFNQFGPAGFQQKYLGPRDTNSPITDSLLQGFDPQRLAGTLPPLPGSYAMIPDSVVNSYPHYNGQGCQAIGVTPVNKAQETAAGIPAGFNSLPSSLPAYSQQSLPNN